MLYAGMVTVVLALGVVGLSHVLDLSTEALIGLSLLIELGPLFVAVGWTYRFVSTL